MLAEGQISITRADGMSLVLHGGTPYRVNRFEPFERAAQLGQGGPVPFGDGSWRGTDWRAAAAIPMSVGMRAADWSGLMDLWWALDAACAPTRLEGPAELRFNAAGTEYLMYVHPQGARLRNRRGRTGKAWAETTLEALDPAIYSAVEHSVTVGLLRHTGGMTVPVTVPAVIVTVAADGVATLSNAGRDTAYPVYRIDGPVVRPVIALTGLDGLRRTLAIDLSIGSGEWLTIDTKAESVLLNGSVSRLSSASGSWPVLAGLDEATLLFRAAEYNDTASLTVTHRDTW